MNDQKHELGSPTGLRSSFKPSNFKSLQTLTTLHPKTEESKVASGHSSTLGNYGIRGKPEETDKTGLKPTDGKPLLTHKKFSAQFDPKQIPPPRQKDDAVQLKSTDPAVKSQPVLNKEDLRTTFTVNTFVPKTFDKEMLRKTTHTPFRLDIKPEPDKHEKAP